MRTVSRTLLLGLTIMLGGVAAPASSAESPCDLAVLNAAAGRLGVAHSLYDEVLKAKSPPPCALTGLATVVDRQTQAQLLTAQAKSAADQGDKTGAISKLGEALKIDPSSADASTVLYTFSGDSKDPYRGALALLRAGYPDEARAEARKVAVDKGLGRDLPTELKAGHDWKRRFDDFVAWLTSALPAVGIPLIVLYVAVAGVVRVFRRPKVSIEPLVDPSSSLAIGAGLTNMLIDEMQSNGTGSNLERVNDGVADTGIDLADVLGDRWKWLTAVATKVTSRRLVVVKGDAFVLTSTDDPKMAEVGITLNVISHQRQVVATKSFIARSSITSATNLLLSLLPMAGAWATTTLADKTKAAHKHVMLGTNNWQSWGKFRQGVWYHDRGDRDTARARYLDALAADAKNVGAWTNLASLDVRKPEGWGLAIERLGIVERLILEDREANVVWYRALNLRAVTLLHRSTATNRSAEERAADEADARRAALELVRSIARARNELKHVVRAPAFAHLHEAQEADLKNVVHSTAEVAVTLLASTLVHPDALPPVDPASAGNRQACFAALATLRDDVRVERVLGLLKGLRSDAELPGPAHYNLACLYARAFGLTATPAQRTAYVDTMMLHLGRGVEASTNLAVWARDTDPAFAKIREDAAANERFVTFLNKLAPSTQAAPALDSWKLVISDLSSRGVTGQPRRG